MYEVLKYIHENIKTTLELSHVASHFGYSKWHFCSKFHDYTGKSFVKYIRHYRLQLAAIDILSGLKVTDVAIDYGYDTLGGFNKAFLAEFGCLPRDYKNQAKESRIYYERRKITMYPLTDRCESLRKIMVEDNDYQRFYSCQHRVYSTIAMDEAKKKNLSNTEIVTSGIVNVLNKFMPVIIPGELLVGINFADAKFGEYYRPEDNEEDLGVMKDNGISDADIEAFLKVEEKPWS